MLSFKAILEIIQRYQTIVILRHQHPDPDAIGSQCGLREILRANFPQKKILATGYDEPTLTYLATMDPVSQLTADSSYLAIVVDTANTPRIDDATGLWRAAASVLKIDHHPNDDAYTSQLWVEPERSSSSEMVADWALATGLTVPPAAARLLYAGIVGDTGRFLFPSTSPATLAIASQLAERDFDRAGLGREMASFEPKIARLQGYVYEHLEISPAGAARVTLTRQLMADFDVTESETSMVVGTAGNIRSVKSWAVFVEQDDGIFRVRLRSKTIPISDIAKRHHGGGHDLASGAKALTPDEQETIWQELQDAVK